MAYVVVLLANTYQGSWGPHSGSWSWSMGLGCAWPQSHCSTASSVFPLSVPGDPGSNFGLCVSVFWDNLQHQRKFIESCYMPVTLWALLLRAQLRASFGRQVFPRFLCPLATKLASEISLPSTSSFNPHDPVEEGLLALVYR